MGRPKKKPAKGDADKVFALRSVGAGKGTCARRVNISTKTLDRWIEEYPQITEAWEAGGSQLETDLVKNLYEIAMDKKHMRCATAAIFLLKTLRGFVDNPEPAPVKTAVQINIPPPLSPENYQELIAQVRPAGVIDGKVVSDEQ